MGEKGPKADEGWRGESSSRQPPPFAVLTSRTVSRPRWIVVLALAIFATQLVLAHVYCGFLTGDEVESLSEAFRVATDYDYQAWEARNTLVARLFVAPWVRVAIEAGVTDRGALVVVATIPFALATAITILMVHALSLRWTADPLAAAAATLLFALHWLPLGFGSTTFPRVIAMACIVGAALLISRRTAAGAAGAGTLIGLAFADRYSEGMYVLPLLLIAGRQAWIVALSSLASISILSGVYEWAVWGTPFHSLRTFAKITLFGGDYSSRVQHQPFFWYLMNVSRWCAVTLSPFLWSARRAFQPLAFVLLALLTLTLIAHKELRFLQSVIPFLSILGGIGFAAWYRTRRDTAVALLVLSLAWNLWGIRFLSRETKPAVEAARFLATQPALRTIALGQVWAYGDRIYLGNDPRLIDVGTPIHSLDVAVKECDAIAVYESDVTPDVAKALAAHGFRTVRTFRAPRARDVVVFSARAGR